MDKTNISQELTIINIVRLLWKDKYMIVLITSIFSICAVLYSLSLQNYYTSFALMSSTQIESNSKSSLLSNMGGLASLAGIQMSQGTNDKSEIAITKMKSKQFFEHLLSTDPLILPSIMAPLNYDKNLQKLIYDPEQYIFLEKKWIREVKEPFQTIPSIQESHKIFLNMFNVSKDDQTGFVSISVKHISPYFAERFLSIIVAEINNITRQKDLKDSELALNYLKDESNKNSNKNIDNSINALMQAEMEKQMLTQITENYVFEFIDKPFIPELKTGPNRAIICIVAFFAGLFFACLISLFRFNFKPAVYNKYD